ncbi:TolC family protein [Reichenbachiella ulvae]|uniref:TolC family protein n=1 Tax=Reichenbachiella ulvae TaxID=2980104 RepID=A0ABT3CXY9_9BACT|nr:TolC family protein [Reichenbachiella ulvae]MCV9388563.1 TolC family protein [Reichenbachiella ulvae]
MKKLILYILLVTMVFGAHAQELDQYLQEAYENNPGLKASYHEFEAAMKRVAQVSALPDPTLSFGYFISPIETRVGAQRAKLSLSQMFPWFGTISARKDLAAMQAEARYQQFLDDKAQLTLKVKQAYFPILELQEQIRIQEQNLGLLESYKRVATTSYANGRSSMTDVLRVDLRLDDLKTEIQLMRDQMKPLSMAFAYLLHHPDSVSLSFEDSLSIEDQWLVNQANDSNFWYHPKMEGLSQNLSTWQAKEQLSNKNAMPQIGLGLDYAFVAKREGISLPDNGKDAIMPMVTLSIPIYQKKYRGEKEESRLMQTAVQNRMEDLQSQLQSQYETAWYEAKASWDRYQLFEQQEETTHSIIDLLYTEYAHSGQNFEELLRMQQQLLKYELAKVTAAKSYQLALAKLNYLTFNAEENESGK